MGFDNGEMLIQVGIEYRDIDKLTDRILEGNIENVPISLIVDIPVGEPVFLPGDANRGENDV